ncbi:caspase family protein [Streptomyces sp. NBC_00638]|uniref:peptidoglycan-binding protein n=1 Tax=unclassified Streptomyces TaxID=2593676 RepID=UPI0022534214|nr:peptidoglycan-binding protein [Streptomyces sp. NBC_00638]MCX5009307.1 caspase family protein [Streptomyces sp. NBC_00638]
MRTLRWGDTGDDVASLQRALQARGHYRGAVNGRFGAPTRSAVAAFQRAHGLAADGVASPSTLAALGVTGPQAPPLDGTPQPPAAKVSALSLHIGLNSVDPDAYGGWSGRLRGCEHDARTMTGIARAEGFTTRSLLTREATSANVLDAIADTARQLGPGDMFLLTYSGHGGQIAQTGKDDRTETDRKNETWVLYDRMLIDDELSAAFAAFRQDVNIVLLSDSCHSGSLYRLVPGSQESEHAAAKCAFYEDGSGRDGDGSSPPMTRAMPFDVNTDVMQAGAGMYRAIQAAVRSRSAIVANGVAIGGCQDNQLAQEVGGAGVFTSTLERVWAGNAFAGSYEELHRAVGAQMSPQQTPELGLFGSRPETLVARTPFDAGGLAGAAPTG